jgi:hypothetical protein
MVVLLLHLESIFSLCTIDLCECSSRSNEASRQEAAKFEKVLRASCTYRPLDSRTPALLIFPLFGVLLKGAATHRGDILEAPNGRRKFMVEPSV